MASDSNDNLSTPSTQVARASTAPSSRASSTAPSSAALGISSEEDDNEDDDLEKKRPWVDDPHYRTCDNSPGKRRPKSDVWNHVKRLKDNNEKRDTYTHICVYEGCGKLLILVKPRGRHYYTTTKAFKHMTDEHEGVELFGQKISMKKQVSY